MRGPRLKRIGPSYSKFMFAYVRSRTERAAGEGENACDDSRRLKPPGLSPRVNAVSTEPSKSPVERCIREAGAPEHFQPTRTIHMNTKLAAITLVAGAL